MADETIPRRSFLKGAGAAGAAVATALTTPAEQAAAQTPGAAVAVAPAASAVPAATSEAYLTLTVTEANHQAVKLYKDSGFFVRHRFDAMVLDKP